MIITASRLDDSSSDQRATKSAHSRKLGWMSKLMYMWETVHVGSMQHATYSRRAAQYCCHIHEDQGTFFTVRNVGSYQTNFKRHHEENRSLWRLMPEVQKQQLVKLSCWIFFLPDAIRWTHISKPLSPLETSKVSTCFWKRDWKVDFQLIIDASLEMITLAWVQLVFFCNPTCKLTWTEMFKYMHIFLLDPLHYYYWHFHNVTWGT